MTYYQFLALFNVGLAAVVGVPYGLPSVLFAMYFFLQAFRKDKSLSDKEG